MTPQAREFIKHISAWLSTKPKLVIGVEGYSGSGKTTLVKEVAANMEANVVHMDEFQVSEADVKKLEESLPNKEDVFVQKYRFDLLRDLVDSFRRGEASVRYDLIDPDTDEKISKTFVLDTNVLVIDGIWLSDKEHLSGVFDKIVLLDVDADVADSRRRQREKQDWEAGAWEETDPDSYISHYKLAHRKYVEKYSPEQNADLVIKSTS